MGEGGICVYLLIVAEAFAPPPPEDDHSGLRGGRRLNANKGAAPAQAPSEKRSLFMDMSEVQQQQAQQAKMQDEKKRTLFMELPEDDQRQQAPPQDGKKRSLFMELPVEEQQQQPQDSGKKKRTLFMELPDEEPQSQPSQYGQKRSLAVDVDGVTSRVKTEQGKAQGIHYHAVVPLFAFPGLKARRFVSESLMAQGHDSVISRALMLAEIGEVHEAEKAQERDDWEHAFTRRYGEDDVPKRWLR